MKKISMVIVAISAMISLSGCHEDPTYVESYFQRQSVIEKLSNKYRRRHIDYKYKNNKKLMDESIVSHHNEFVPTRNLCTEARYN